MSPSDTAKIEAEHLLEITLNLEKLFCPCRALGLIDDDELFECLSAAVVKLRRGNNTDGHVSVGGKNLLEQSGQRLRGEEKRQSAAGMGWMDAMNEWLDGSHGLVGWMA